MNSSEITEQFDSEELDNEEDSDKLYQEPPYNDAKIMAQFNPTESDNEE